MTGERVEEDVCEMTDADFSDIPLMSQRRLGLVGGIAPEPSALSASPQSDISNQASLASNQGIAGILFAWEICICVQ